MRELDLETTPQAHAPAPVTGPSAGASPLSIAIVGNGRAGNAFAEAIAASTHSVIGPLHRHEAIPAQVDVVLVCVPDSATESVAESVPPGPLVAHCCGAHGLDLLAGRRGFCIHPLMTLSGAAGDLGGAYAAIDASDPTTFEIAQRLAVDLGLKAISIDEADRAAYHAAASIASNFLVTLEAAAERLAADAGLPREALVPLVERTIANWADSGPEAALTGPVARGDLDTVERQRTEIGLRMPDLLPLFDALRDATERLATTGAGR